jgi:hypothetical protein
MRLESILRDVGFGVRLCRRHKIVTAAALISLSFAIGACTAGFPLIVSMLSTSRTVLNLDLQVNWRMLVFLAGPRQPCHLLVRTRPRTPCVGRRTRRRAESSAGKQTARVGLFRPLVPRRWHSASWSCSLLACA